MGSYYENIRDCRTNGSKFPSPLEAWVGSYEELDTLKEIADKMFPSPLEDWGVSYGAFAMGGVPIDISEFPSPLEDWVVSYVSLLLTIKT